MDELYIDVKTKTDDDYCHMSVYSAITLFVYKFCHVDQHLTLRFVTVRLLSNPIQSNPMWYDGRR